MLQAIKQFANEYTKADLKKDLKILFGASVAITVFYILYLIAYQILLPISTLN